jgi:HPt (histidine-containing phosphotransfer) domain-containing protein
MNREEKAKELLDQLWRKHFPEMHERVEILRQASDVLQRGPLTDEAREAARLAAHKLAGALGTFGRGEGTDLARTIEGWFSEPNELPMLRARIKAAVETLQTLVVL